MASIEVVSAVNNDSVLESNLLRSPDIADGRVPVLLERGRACAGAAYNAALDRASSELVAFVHQDVYLPAGWADRLLRAVRDLEQDAAAKPWGVMGVWGVRGAGEYAGRVWCTGGNTEHAVAIDRPVEVQSIDEVVIVLRRSSSLRFDERLPGFHLYATDIVLEARQRGLATYVFDAPVVHNSRGNPRPVDGMYLQAYRYMQRKWSHVLPVETAVVALTRTGWPLYKHLVRRELHLLRVGATHRERDPAPARIAARLGYEAGTESRG
ncbi:MAG TPA: hypothetical protein VER17_10085 [Tepidisphaeraceae bacterium]|nr:hypothetical protein [Tepidisphaeraceae bacterium]